MIVSLAVSGGLLVLSGMFSSSETALFSLDEDGRRRAGARAEALLASLGDTRAEDPRAAAQEDMGDRPIADILAPGVVA